MTLRQAPTRKVIVVVGVILAFAVAGIMLTVAWMSALTIPIMHSENLKITDAQFNKGFLTVTVKNTGDTRYDLDVITITQILVVPIRQDLHFLNQTFPMSIPIHVGEQASITVGYERISGEVYLITLTSARGGDWHYNAVAP